ncbi:hypothetical protein [Microtetraspora sp. AC03309]|uniref:hypothetical protein n=1 Tax=Microtetraspora sp. AC03309 TaxID=2779376 RepID=UPI001E35D82C|nr:hypothetical protein [Microtetraspora sp. AC03309]
MSATTRFSSCASFARALTDRPAFLDEELGNLQTMMRCGGSVGMGHGIFRSGTASRRPLRASAWPIALSSRVPHMDAQSVGGKLRGLWAAEGLVEHPRVRAWAADNDVELVFLPTYGSWLNWIESEFAALRYYALNGTDHRSHDEQNAAIGAYVRWRNARAAARTRARRSRTAVARP